MENRNDKYEESYTKEDICAVIVSYNPDEIFLKNIEALTGRVASIIVVDNGSAETSYIVKAKEKYKIDIMELHKNMGIAYALNKGLDLCTQNGYKLLLTMDQDTVLDACAVSELIKAMQLFKAQAVGINWDGKALKDEVVRYLITSGNLVSVDAANRVRGYDNQFFIDSVDFDFSLRLSDCGYKMVKVAKATAIHQLGESQDGSNYTTHSVDRYYYIYRNHFYLIKKHWKNHKIFCLKKQLALVMDLFRIVVWDKDKNKKLKMLHKGYIDAKNIGCAR